MGVILDGCSIPCAHLYEKTDEKIEKLEEGVLPNKITNHSHRILNLIQNSNFSIVQCVIPQM